MYDRSTDDGELNFEASGALENASLVMRDRETDSWWSIMSSVAIGGGLAGQGLRELPIGEKATWGDWRSRHPESLVLSVDGVEHVDNNPYDSYFTSEGTFRGLEIDDRRLAPKTPVYTFRLEGRSFAIAHDRIERGQWVEIAELPKHRLYFYRPVGASIFRSTVAHSVPVDTAESGDASAMLAQLERGEIEGAERLDGFDTFWYTWVSANPETEVLAP